MEEQDLKDVTFFSLEEGYIAIELRFRATTDVTIFNNEEALPAAESAGRSETKKRERKRKREAQRTQGTESTRKRNLQFISAPREYLNH